MCGRCDGEVVFCFGMIVPLGLAWKLPRRARNYVGRYGWSRRENPRTSATNPSRSKTTPHNSRRHINPHVHCLVSGGGISEDASTWHPARRNFLVPIKALDKLVRGKFRDLLRRKCPDLIIPEAVWSKRWILHVTAWGDGEQAVLEYLARYVFRIALTNSRIVGLDDETVTIKYRERKTGRRRTCRPAATSSCAASSSMCCRAASTRSVTSGCGIPGNATPPPGCGRCCNSRHPRSSTSRWSSLFRRSWQPTREAHQEA
jgi:hypothetical protein